jgi:hypothetical protein
MASNGGSYSVWHNLAASTGCAQYLKPLKPDLKVGMFT